MIADPGNFRGPQTVYFHWVHSNSGSTETYATGDWYPQIIVIEGPSSSCGNFPSPDPEPKRRRLRYEPPPIAPWERDCLSRESFLRGVPGMEARSKLPLRACLRAKHRREHRWHPNQERAHDTREVQRAAE